MAAATGTACDEDVLRNLKDVLVFSHFRTEPKDRVSENRRALFLEMLQPSRTCLTRTAHAVFE